MIRLATDKFVPVSADDWYQRRRDDAEGDFFRRVADQGPRKGKGGSTRQGIYCFTASGKLLAFRNAQEADVMRQTVEQALKRFEALPASETKPGAVEVPARGKVDPRYARTPPEGGLILRTYTRILDRDGERFVKGTCDFTGGDRAARDHVWLKAAEWRALVPADPKRGDTFAMPAALAARLCRFHLVDGTRGEPEYWSPEQVRKADMKWTVESVSDAEVTLTLVGSALMATEAESAKRGYDAALSGRLRYDRKKKAVVSMEVVALGDHWGRSAFTPGDRPGRKPLGVSMELVAGDRPDERVPPQAARDLAGYYGGR